MYNLAFLFLSNHHTCINFDKVLEVVHRMKCAMCVGPYIESFDTEGRTILYACAGMYRYAFQSRIYEERAKHALHVHATEM